MRSEEVLNDGGIIREGVTVCHAALSVKTNVLCEHNLNLEPHAHVMHVRDADKR